MLNILMNKLKLKGMLALQILFTMLAFLAMAFLSYFFIYDTINKSLVRNAESVFTFTQTQLESTLLEAKTTLSGFSQSIRTMILRGDDINTLQNYVDEIYNYVQFSGNHTIDTSGFSVCIEFYPDEPVFIISSNMETPANYNMTERPWYKMAIAAGNNIIETLPYYSAISGEYVITYARRITDDIGRYLGITCLNLHINSIGRNIVDTALAQGGYGILLSQDLKIIAHTNPDFIGEDLRNPIIPLSAHVDKLLEGNEILKLPLLNWKREKTIALFRQIPNGWYLGLLTPEGPFYQPISYMAFVLGVLAAIFTAVLVIILIKIDAAKNRSTRESRHKSEFLASMSHEMRTPMNAIIGMTYIGKTSADSEKKDYCFSKIEEASSHLLGVINDILDMSKIEVKKLCLLPVEFNLEKMLQRVISINNFRIEEKKQKLTISIDQSIPKTLIGDDQRLAQVITNLLSNAIKFTALNGSITLEALLCKKEGKMNTIQISVSDTGIGISREQQERIFNLFEQAESSTTRKYGGTGLGLSISRSIVDLMGGRIWVKSEQGKGSTFYFDVKMESGPEREQAPDGEKTQPELTGIFSGKRVLLAEDVEINREIVKYLLKPSKIEIDYAENGKEAVKMFCEAGGNYDLILMDIQMPEMDGYEATRRIRSLNLPHAKKIPIIAKSANVLREDRKKCLESGMNNHIGKPLDLTEVLKLLRIYLFRD